MRAAKTALWPRKDVICGRRRLGQAIGMQPPSSVAECTELRPWEGRPASQQPDWRDHRAYQDACHTLASAAPLVSAAEIRQLREELSGLVTTNGLLLQVGDCAESFYECTPWHTAKKLAVMDRLGD